MSAVKLIHVTPNAEATMAYCARVSSDNQDNPDYARLLKYCIKNKHWSVFQMASLCVEITTSRAIAQQILRHRSLNFQEFSQRYSTVNSYESYEARRQDVKNRQNSIDDMSEETKEWFKQEQEMIWRISQNSYEQALKMNIAKEQARFLLPLNTTTKMYIHGTVRDWIHYISLRQENGTQKEHQEIALAIKEIFKEQFPDTSKALEWLD